MAVMLKLELTSPSNSSAFGADPQALHFHKPLQINDIHQLLFCCLQTQFDGQLQLIIQLQIKIIHLYIYLSDMCDIHTCIYTYKYTVLYCTVHKLFDLSNLTVPHINFCFVSLPWLIIL